MSLQVPAGSVLRNCSRCARVFLPLDDQEALCPNCSHLDRHLEALVLQSPSAAQDWLRSNLLALEERL